MGQPPPGEAQAAPLIELVGVTRVFEEEGGERVQALDGVSLRIDAGEFVCVTGPSGSGKTTMMHIMGGLDRATSGECRIAGTDIAELDDDGLAALRRESFGFVFQSYNLLEALTARDNVELPATYVAGASNGRKRAHQLLQSFGLKERSGYSPAELSGGEQQRVAIARALMNGPSVILADEPTGALDTEQGGQVLALLEQLAERGRAVVLVSHDAAVANRARRRIELRDGRVVADSGPAPATDAVQPPRPPGRAGLPWLAAVRGGLASWRGGRLRAGLTVVSIALGIWLAGAVLSLVEGARRDVMSAVERMGANRLSVGGIDVVGNQVRFLPKTMADARAIAEEIPNVQTVIPAMRKPLDVQFEGEHMEDVDVRGTPLTEPRTADAVAWPLTSGVYLDQRDQDRGAQVAVIGPTVRKQLFAQGVDPVGQHIHVGGVPFEVKGVLATYPRNEKELRLVRVTDAGLKYFGMVVYVPFATGRDMLFGTENLWRLDVLVRDVSRLDETASEIKDLMFRRHGVEGYTVENDALRLAAYTKLSATQATIVSALSVVALLVGGLGVMSVTLTSVNQRRREIGIRRAMGARRRDILWQFLVETSVLTAVGGACGVLLVFAGGPLLSNLVSATVGFAPWFVPAALACAVATGMIFAVVPALRGARLDPVAALSPDR
ncbi:MAG: ATP-binding cassette domain-containing protein [Gammaproteobacteria bacterium]|nr:ATP-binding cassette domain-containing protein [Gammaproteobacteria bacterium]